MPAFEPNLELTRQAFGRNIEACRSELIKISLGWSRVYRVTLEGQGHPAGMTVIVKTLDPAAAPSALEARRELHFYETLHPTLCIAKPEVHLLKTDEASGFYVVVMEDLTRTHRIPAHPHIWTRKELPSVLRAYAKLHTQTLENSEYEWLAPRHEELLNPDTICDQVAVVQRAGIWQDLPGLADLISFARESCQRYADARLSLVHGDTTPANAALPGELETEPATLIDWQDVGAGMAEFDLAYLDLQPFESARGFPRQELLDTYWKYRAEMDPDIPSPEERRARQLHADAVNALWLTTPASRVALEPFPEGTYPHIHWSSQYRIVYNRLRSLIEEINHR